MVDINKYKILVSKPKGMRPLGRHMRSWEDNIGTDLGEIGWEGVNWSRLVQDRVQWRIFVNMIMNLRVPYKTGNVLTISFSTKALLDKL
jgi:hypothetical protein